MSEETASSTLDIGVPEKTKIKNLRQCIINGMAFTCHWMQVFMEVMDEFDKNNICDLSRENVL